MIDIVIFPVQLRVETLFDGVCDGIGEGEGGLRRRGLKKGYTRQ